MWLSSCKIALRRCSKQHWSSGAASRKLTEDLPGRASGNISPCPTLPGRSPRRGLPGPDEDLPGRASGNVLPCPGLPGKPPRRGLQETDERPAWKSFWNHVALSRPPGQISQAWSFGELLVMFCLVPVSRAGLPGAIPKELTKHLPEKAPGQALPCPSLPGKFSGSCQETAWENFW
jgi:hypothetical protein